MTIRMPARVVGHAGTTPAARPRHYDAHVMSDDRNLRAAVLMGLGGGLRSFAPPVALAVHGRGPLAGRARFIAFAVGAGELIADKLPATPSRWSPGGLTPRLVFSSMAGRLLGGAPGAGFAAAAALGSAFAGSHLRTKVHGRGWQFAAAAAEDALSYSLVLTASASLR
jgi:uncharacterized membrane protein